MAYRCYGGPAGTQSHDTSTSRRDPPRESQPPIPGGLGTRCAGGHAEQGIGAVAIEPLARRLGVTKGSFYWYFPTREALLKAAQEHWERIDEEEFLGVEPIRDPRERLRALFRRASREMQSHVVYSALLRALDHASVQRVMSRVSQKRIDFLNVAYRQLGLDRSAASYRARLACAAYAGFLQLSLQLGLPRLSHAEFDEYIDHAISTLIPA